ALVRREVPGLLPVTRAVADAHRKLPEMGEHVELGECELVDPVHSYRVAQRDEVEPPAAPLPAGHGPVLAPELAHPVLVVAMDLRRERAFADAGHVRLRDAEHAVDPLRPDPDAGCRPGRPRV